jgi:ribulose-5-phosphate 4-epimerase/fuculose-1-phosphate aldolase
VRFYSRVSIYDGFGGMGLGEAERLITTLGTNPNLLMVNHGVIAVGETVARDFDNFYYFEPACQKF